MNALFRLAAAGALCSLLAGCFSPDYLSRTQKPNINAVSLTEYEQTDYEILGPVEAEGEGMTVLGIFSEGIDGQGLLWEEARSQYGDQVTGLKDVTSNSEWFNVLGDVYSRVNTTYHAIAVGGGMSMSDGGQGRMSEGNRGRMSERNNRSMSGGNN